MASGLHICKGNAKRDQISLYNSILAAYAPLKVWLHTSTKRFCIQQSNFSRRTAPKQRNHSITKSWVMRKLHFFHAHGLPNRDFHELFNDFTLGLVAVEPFPRATSMRRLMYCAGGNSSWRGPNSWRQAIITCDGKGELTPWGKPLVEDRWRELEGFI